MTIDQSWLENSTNLVDNSQITYVFNEETPTLPSTWELFTYTYKFRYTVHRQFVGFFTPMVFDVSFRLLQNPEYRNAVKFYMDKICEPFVEGALFVNHDSFALVEFLKGQNFGFNRKTLIETIRKTVTTPSETMTPVWYSDWDSPPLTIQNQRLFVYDVDNPQHGSMLDPINAVQFIQRYMDYYNTGIPYSGFQNHFKMLSSYITAGYTTKVAQHADRAR